MTNKKAIAFGLIVAATVALGACRTSPVRNVDEMAYTTDSKDYTMEQVADAIIRAGSGLGWNMQKTGPGELTGTLFLRSHMAKVRIPYDADSYSILYVDSSNLKYDDGKIHSNYNSWVQNLSNAIQGQLSTL